jgi:hypothetical protein
MLTILALPMAIPPLILGALLLSACGPAINMTAGRTEAAAMQLVPGMTRDQVTRLLGPPQGFLTERNGVECLTYTDRDASTMGIAMTIARDRLIILKDGKLVQHGLINTGVAPNVVMQVPGAPSSASTCSQVAARFAARQNARWSLTG